MLDVCTETISCDTAVLATGQKPFGGALIDALKAKGYKVQIIGDAIRPRKIIDAVREGNFAGYQI